MTTVVRLALLVSLVSAASESALAQDVVKRFRLAQDPKNIQGCIAYDSSLTRVHTFSITNGQAEIKSAGGIDDKMKLGQPNVYQTVFALSGIRLDVVADLASTPNTLTVTEKNRGCRWFATAE